eukprot:1023933-Pleurochrysis_carterae.AAC.2
MAPCSISMLLVCLLCMLSPLIFWRVVVKHGRRLQTVCISTGPVSADRERSLFHKHDRQNQQYVHPSLYTAIALIV